jgi:hypothetical protein
MKQPLKGILTVLGSLILAALLFVGGLLLMVRKEFTATEMTKESPDRQHQAKLAKSSGIDVNFRVFLDGQFIFGSPDFAPLRADFREQIVWDKTGRFLLLEIAGERVFGYDVGNRRELSDAEVLAVEFVPFAELGYEGKLPKDPPRKAFSTPAPESAMSPTPR